MIRRDRRHIAGVRWFCALLLGAAVTSAMAGAPQSSCPPPGLLGDGGQVIEPVDAASRNAIALQLLDCLGNPDPALRDDLAYATLARWMRAGELSPATLRQLRDRLLVGLQSTDEAGFLAPFSALVLSEVARVDRVQPYLDDDERQAMLMAATNYLRDVRDYRGFINGDGWRHGVAHGADVLLQLALNPALGREAALPILDAIASQVAPSSVAYHFGEEGRLARVVVVVASRGWLEADGWQAWFERLADPAPMASWNEAFRSEASLNRLHNLRAFLLAVHVRVSDSENAAVQSLLPGLKSAINAIP